MRRGQFNSSITRVRPFFQALLAHPGDGWLSDLLGLVSERSGVAQEMAASRPALHARLRRKRRYADRILGEIELEECFEARMPPPRAFLAWLIENPGAMSAFEPGPDDEGSQKTEKRSALFGLRGPEAALQARAEALQALSTRGPEGSSRAWWAFEGFTEADCLLETDDLVLIVEGKRTEPITAGTRWFPERNQLVRNVEVAREYARHHGRKHFGVLLMAEHPLPVSDEMFIAGLPHLSADEQADLRRHFLGCLTWADACRALKLQVFDY